MFKKIAVRDNFDDAPQTFFGTAKGPPPGESRVRLQRELLDQFPNVSVIDFYDQAEFMRL